MAVSALLELCAARLQFAFCGYFRRVFFRQGIVFCFRAIRLYALFVAASVGFPVLRSVLAVVGVLPFICQSFGGLFRPSGVMILSRFARLPSVFACFRLFYALVGFPLPLIVSRLFRAFFGFVSAVRLYLSSYRRRRASVNLSQNAHF